MEHRIILNNIKPRSVVQKPSISPSTAEHCPHRHISMMHYPRWVIHSAWGFQRKVGGCIFSTRRRKQAVLVGFFISFIILVNFMGMDNRVNVLLYTRNQGSFEETSYTSEYHHGETFCEARKRIGQTTDQDIPIVKQHVEGQNTGCLMPKLDPCDPHVLNDTRPPPLVCPKGENWVYVKNGTFHISQAAVKKYGKIVCEYAPILRDGDFRIKHARHIRPMLDGTPITTDAFKAACVDAKGKRYFNMHLGVPYKPELHERAKTIPLPPNALGGYDIFLFGFDGVSRMQWMRNLPRTREYFLKGLGGVELEGQNILGDGTTNALLPMLTGHKEQDLPSARKGEKGSVFVDTYPFIFKDLKNAGYVTLWGEDGSCVGTFQYRLNGFKDKPVDHDLRPYFLAAEPMNKRFPWGCIGSELRHVRFMNYFRDAYQMYGKKRKFMFGFHSEHSHNDGNTLKLVDEDLLKFFKELKHSGYLEHTILMLMSDHGPRFSSTRSTQQGKLEERNPYFGILLPPGFKAAYPNRVNNLMENRHRMTTMLDVHETFHELLNSSAKRPSFTRGRGISLFQPIPNTRTCADAGIETHWCACFSWKNVTDDVAIKNKTVESIVNYINGLTEPHRDKCERLKWKNIYSISRYRPEKDVLKHKGSSDRHGLVPDMSDNMPLTYEHLQVVFTTTPGDGQFEVTVTHYLNTGEVKVRSEEISRTNKYGEAPACISKSFPHLRPYCYCKSQH